MPRPFEPASFQLLARLAPTCPVAIVAVDLEHRISFCNPAFEHLFHHRIEDALGQDLTVLLEISGGGEMASAVYRLSRAENVRLTLRARRKDQTAVDVEFCGVPDMTNGTYSGYCAVLLDVTERHRTEQALRNAGETLSRVSQALIDAQEKERLRVSNTLHDDVGQRIAAWQMGLDRLGRDHRPSTSEVVEGLTELRKQAGEIATAIRGLARELHAPELSLLSVDRALGELCAEAGRRLNMSVDFGSRRVPRLVDTNMSICLFRVLQEGLTNAGTHSGTRRVRVTLWGTPTAIHLRIRDFGRGFAVETITHGPGVGLITMRERVALVNGTFSITSRPLGGTRIDVSVPLATPKRG